MSDGLSDILDAPLPPLASFIGRPTTQANPPVTSPNRPPVTPPYRPPPVTPPNRPPPVTPPNRPLPVTPPNRPPPVTPPNRPAGTPVNRAPLVPRIPADQVPLPDPPFEALRAIRNYFVKGGQCACEGPVGAGAFGSVYRLRQVGGGGGEGTPGAGRRVVAKLVRRFPDPRYASGTLLDEVEALQSFAAAAHVVRMIDSQTFGGVDQYGVRQWILLEYLEGGTFREFTERVRRRGKPLPNRMMWSIFRCLMRIAVAMAHSGNLRVGPVRLETVQDGPHPTSVLYNTDMHPGNLMFGAYDFDESDEEHRLSPILKMIDLGSIERIDTSRDSEWDRISENLVSLASNRFFALFEIIESLGSKPPDPELRDLVYICTRKEGTFRDKGWSLKDLEGRVQRGFEQGTAYYDLLGVNDGAEDDDNVVAVVRDLFLNAEDLGNSDPDAFPGLAFHPDDSDLSL